MEDNKECIKDQGSAGFESMHRLQPTTERALIATADVIFSSFLLFLWLHVLSIFIISSFITIIFIIIC